MIQLFGSGLGHAASTAKTGISLARAGAGAPMRRVAAMLTQAALEKLAMLRIIPSQSRIDVMLPPVFLLRVFSIEAQSIVEGCGSQRFEADREHGLLSSLRFLAEMSGRHYAGAPKLINVRVL